MSNELRIGSASGLNAYAQIINAAAQRGNNSLTIFETYTPANYANYVTTVNEQGSSAVYIGDFPSWITTAGSYTIFYYRRLGLSPAQGDPLIGTGVVNWNGSAAISGSVANALSGSQFYDYVLQIFKRTDKSTEIYAAIGEVIREIRRRFKIGEDEVETTTTDTITVLGDYKIDTEENLSLFVSEVVVLDGDNSWQLVPISKSEFDYLYPNPGSTTAYRSRPEHFCIFGDQILLGNVPDKTSYRYKVSMTIDDYLAITSISTAVPYSNKYKDMLRSGTLKRAFEIVEEYQTAGYWEGQFEKLFGQTAEKEDKNRMEQHAVKYNDF